MKNSRKQIKSSASKDLFFQSWDGESAPKAQLLIIHGYAEHSDRYKHVAEFMTANQVKVSAMDLRGHGNSAPGEKPNVKDFDEYLDDVDAAIAELDPALPTFLFGHSMGGLITTLLALKRKPKVNGVLLSGAALKVSDDIPKFLIWLSGFIGKLFPSLPTIKLDGKAISKDPEQVNLYENDPKIYRGGILAGLGRAMNMGITYAQEHGKNFDLPVLIMHGSADRLTDPQGSQMLYDQAKSTDKSIKMYDGLFHELVNEPEKETVMKDMLSWIEERLRR